MDQRTTHQPPQPAMSSAPPATLGPPAPRAPRADAAILAALVAFTIASRIHFLPPGLMGFDGPEYLNALKLDSTFNVPPPGNIGYVWLARAFGAILPSLQAYLAADILLTCVGVAFTYLLGRSILSRPLAGAAALCAATSAMVWYHGLLVQSYIVWFAAMPAIGYFALRFMRERSWPALIAVSLATGLSTILRPDLVFFGGPLLGAALLLGRARWSHWLGAAGICAACCLVWLLGTGAVLGGDRGAWWGVEELLRRSRAKQSYHEGFGAAGKGLVEGVARNGVKYSQFLFWSCHAALLLAACAGVWYARRARSHWRAWVFVVAWAAPSVAFSLLIFTGAAGFILPVVPLMYLAGAKWLSVRAADASPASRVRRPWAPTAMLLALAAVNLAQFSLLRPVRLSDQRRALINHMFLGYTGPGLTGMYDYQLDDFKIDKSLKGTVNQFLRSEPVPVLPERVPERLRPLP